MPGPDSPPVTIVDARDGDFRLVPEFYRTVIVPNFPPDELQTQAELMERPAFGPQPGPHRRGRGRRHARRGRG